MAQPILTGTLTRFWAGLSGGVLVGWVVFRGEVFRPDEPAFQCITVGALTAGVMALVRPAGRGHAFGLVVAFGVLCHLVSSDGRWIAGLSGLLLGLGILLVALVYEELARSGIRFGKFLLVGPMLGGVYLAVAPITEFRDLTVSNAAHVYLFQFLLGFLIGDGVGFGVELVDRFPSPFRWKGRGGTG